MVFEIKQQGAVAVVHMRGDLTAEFVVEWQKAMESQLLQRVRDFVLDCHGLGSMDSKGLEALLWLHDACVDRLGQVRLVGCNEDLEAVLAMTRLDVLFDRHPDVADAMEGLKC